MPLDGNVLCRICLQFQLFSGVVAEQLNTHNILINSTIKLYKIRRVFGVIYAVINLFRLWFRL